jgi:hypothetical protein
VPCKKIQTPVNIKKGKAVVGQRKNQPVKSINRMMASRPASEVHYAPVAKTTIVRTNKPVIRAMPNGSTRITHTEYIGDIFGSVNFNAVGYAVQPGVSASFPWLSLMAPLYESYRMNSLQFKFLTEKSTATNGVVFMAVDYDAQDAAPVNKTALLSYSKAARGAPWQDFSYNCLNSDMNKIPIKYIRTATVTGADLKTFDIGNLFICTQGCADTTALGELHVSYDIEFQTPQLDFASFASSGSNSSTGTTGISGTLMLGTAPVLNIAGSGMSITYNTSTGAMTFGTVGSYLVTIIVNGGTFSGTTTVTATGGATVSTVADYGTTSARAIQFTVRIANITDVLTFAGITWSVAPSTSTLKIASYPYGL